MLKFIPIASVSKDFFDLLEKTKRQKKTVSFTKLIIVSVICFFVVALYAWWVNQASTRGYYLKQENKNYDSLVFKRSIAQLDTLQLERKLYDTILQGRKTWYEDDTRHVVVTIGKPATIEQQPILSWEAIDLQQADLTVGSIVINEKGDIVEN